MITNEWTPASREGAMRRLVDRGGHPAIAIVMCIEPGWCARWLGARPAWWGICKSAWAAEIRVGPNANAEAAMLAMDEALGR